MAGRDPRWQPVRRLVRIPNPAAGAELSIDSDTGELWLVRSIVATLTTDATVANRVPVLLADDGTTEYFRTRSESVQAASLAVVYCGFSGSAGGVVAGASVPLPWPTDGLPLPPGHRLRTSTVAIVAGDQWSAVGLWVDAYPHGTGAEWARRIMSDME